MPVVLLHYFGPSLGGPEAPRWAGLLEAVLAGWVLYVAATGMVVEGLLRLKLRRQFSADLFVALAALVIYVYSLVALVCLFRFRSAASSPPPLFHLVVILLAAWSALRWQRGAKRDSNSCALF